MPIPHRTPLIAEMRLEAKHVASLNQILAEVLVDLDQSIADYPNDNPITVMQAKAQRAAMNDFMNRTFDSMEDVTRVGMAEAARAASAVVSKYENELLKLVLDKKAVQALAASEANRAAQGIGNALKRMQGTSYKPLSKTVYGTKQLASGWVDNTINKGLASGWSRQRLAQELRKSIDPKVPGGVSYAANRTARTEINNAFHATSADRYNKSVIVEGVDWNLSSSHPEGDECDTLADNSPYDKKNVPQKPHPNCYCFITPALPTEEEFMEKLFNGDYDPEDAPWVNESSETKLSSALPDPKKMNMDQVDAAISKQARDLRQFGIDWENKHGDRVGLSDSAPFKALRSNYSDLLSRQSALIKEAKDAAKLANVGKHVKIDKLPRMSKPNSLKDAYVGGKVNPNGRGFVKNNRRNLRTDNPDYNINCTRVAYATEMRMRGYDITAGPAGKAANKSDAWIQANWIDKNGNTRKLKRSASPEVMMRDMLKDAPDGARYFVVAPWKQGGAHIWNAEKVNGQIIFHEGQVEDLASGTKAMTSGRMDRMDFQTYKGTATSPRWMRVDDLEPTDSAVTRGWVEVDGKIKK